MTKAPRYYTTGKKAKRFVAEIIELLTDFDAESFMVENHERCPVAIAFSRDGIAYRVRPNIEGLRERAANDRVTLRAEPEDVAWAQARHLLELQLEAIASGSARSSEVLGGYVLTNSGRTIGDMIEERAAELMPGERLLLPSGEVE